MKKKYLRDTIGDLRKNTEGMSRRERAEYVLTYYWLPIGGVLFGIAFAVYFFSHLLFGIRENWIYVTFVNVLEADDGVTALRDDFTDYAGYDLREKNIVFNANSYFDATTIQGTNNNYFQAFVATVEAGDLDAVVGGAENIEAIGSAGRLKDFSSDEMRELFGEYADRFVFCKPNNEGYSAEEVPVGIDISDSRIVTDYRIYTGDCVLGVGAYTENVDEVLRFLDYIYE